MKEPTKHIDLLPVCNISCIKKDNCQKRRQPDRPQTW